MNFEKIKSDIEEKRETTDHFLKKEKEGEFYPAYDCDLKDFDSRFGTVLSDPGISEYLDHNYHDRKGELIGIELGGPGCKLFAGLKGYFAKTAGFTLYQRPNISIPDGHEVVEADVFSKRIQKNEDDLSGYQKIEDWVRQNGRADLMIVSMGDGFMSLSEELLFMNIKRWYKLISETGTVLIDLPDVFEGGKHLFEKDFLDFLSLHKDIFEFNYRSTFFLLKLRIRKLNNAPDSLDGLINEYTHGR